MLAAGVIRQAFVLSAIVRTGASLGGGTAPVRDEPGFCLVLPVLREAGRLADSVARLRALACGHAAEVIVVTTAREQAAPGCGDRVAGDTVAVARHLAARNQCAHLHYGDTAGTKADQLNLAVASLAARLAPGTRERTFVVCYDADSWPPPDALGHFAAAIAAHPGADVFHHSSSFGISQPGQSRRSWRDTLARVLCEGGALRANRFVAGFEIPRLRNRPDGAGPSRVKRRLCSGVYAHVTGQGLCVRLSLLERLPVPARAALEDMHYSFVLCSRGLPMISVPVLGRTEVPATVAGQFRQARRWFTGPAAIGSYLRDPATRRGWRATVLAASALGSAAEWLGCAVVPLAVTACLVTGPRPVRAAAAAFAVICCGQAVLTEAWLGAPAPPRVRVARVAALPFACTVHGCGGVAAAARMIMPARHRKRAVAQR